jgi:hypothetical protein
MLRDKRNTPPPPFCTKTGFSVVIQFITHGTPLKKDLSITLMNRNSIAYFFKFCNETLEHGVVAHNNNCRFQATGSV